MRRHIGVLTSGGDAPGMNAAVRAVVRTAVNADCRTTGFMRGYSGLIDDVSRPLGPRDVANIIQRGGSILETSRERRFREPEWRDKAIDTLRRHALDALVVIGGEGSQTGASIVQSEWDGAVLGVASTIDNDLGGTDFSIGFDTACNTALDAIDRIRDTAHTLDRLFFIEVMGRRRGFIALDVALGGGAEAVLLPEIPLDTSALVEIVRRNFGRGKLACIIVVAEGAHPGGARGLLQELDERMDSLDLAGVDARVTILGHIQRGGNPTVRDRVLASRLGRAAALAAIEGRRDRLFGVRGADVCETPIAEAVTEVKRIDRSLLDAVNSLA